MYLTTPTGTHRWHSSNLIVQAGKLRTHFLHSPWIFSYKSFLTVRGQLLCTVRCTLLKRCPVHTTDLIVSLLLILLLRFASFYTFMPATTSFLCLWTRPKLGLCGAYGCQNHRSNTHEKHVGVHSMVRYYCSPWGPPLPLSPCRPPSGWPSHVISVRPPRSPDPLFLPINI